MTKSASRDAANVRAGRSGSVRAVPLFVMLAALLQILTPVLPSLGVGTFIGSQSNSVRTLVTPAGWAFAIWGALYSGSLAFAVFQSLPRAKASPLLSDIRLSAAAAFLGNAAWAAYVQCFGLGFPSVVIIAFTLINLLTIYLRLSNWREGFSVAERWVVVLPLSALTAWLTVASIVNVAATLRFYGVDGGTAASAIAGAVLLVSGGIAAATLLRTKGNPPFALVFLWALAAIYAAHGASDPVVGTATAMAAIATALGALIGLYRGGRAHWLAGRRASTAAFPRDIPG